MSGYLSRHVRLALALPLAVALGLTLAAASPLAASSGAGSPGTGGSLSELETLARVAAPLVRLAQAELDVAGHRNDAARAGQGARLFGGGGLNVAREAVTDTLSRDYRRLNAQLGVRWPLLGSRNAQVRSLREAELAAAQGQQRLRQARSDAVQTVRRAYVRQVRTTQRLQIAQVFLDMRPRATAQLDSRHRSGLMLEAERLKLLGLFDAVQIASNNQLAQQALNLSELSRLTGQHPQVVQTQPMVWPETCRSADTLLASADESPAIALAQLELNTWGQIADTLKHTGLEASISLAQGLTHDIGGPNGRNTAVAIDFSMPLQWRAQRDAALGQIQGERTRLENLLQVRRGEFHALAEQHLAQWQLRQAELAGLVRRLEAAHEAVRVASRRLEAFDGDGYASLLTARHELYQASIQVIDGAERRDLAQLDLLALAPESCGSAIPAAQDEGSAVLSTLPAGFAAAAKAAPAPDAVGWYAWEGQALVERPSRLHALPSGSTRVLISFTAVQLHRLTLPSEKNRLLQLLAKARSLGIRVELLLGEPAWVLPAHRQDLLDLLARLRALPFDGLNLDLERSQLPSADQPLWDDAVVETLQAVRAAVPWPLGLTTHYRELQSPDFAQRIAAAGVSELVAMIYVSNPVRAADIARPLLQGPVGLRLAVAQSMESTLPPEESSYSVGKAAALQRWRQLAKSLEGQPGFSGVLIQSLEEFNKARP